MSGTDRDLSSKFSELLKAQIREKRDRWSEARSILEVHRAIIAEARGLRVPCSKIAGLLNQIGVKATPLLVREFCKAELGENPRKRRRIRVGKEAAKRKPKLEPMVSLVESAPLKTAHPHAFAQPPTQQKSRPGFRTSRRDLV